MARTTEKLTELNELLADPKLDLPSVRRSVDASGRNLAWLKKHAEQRNEISPRLRELLDTPIRELAR